MKRNWRKFDRILAWICVCLTAVSFLARWFGDGFELSNFNAFVMATCWLASEYQREKEARHREYRDSLR